MQVSAVKNTVPDEHEREESFSQSYHDILSAAATCFRENGFSATSIDDVARHLNATKGMIYHHFRSKADLFFAVYRRGMELNFQAVRPYAEQDNNAEEKLALMALAHVTALMEHQAFQRVLGQGVDMHQSGSTTAAQRETLRELIAIRGEYELMFRKAITDLAAEKDLSNMDFSVASKSFLAVLNGTVFWYTPREEDESDEKKLAIDLVTFAMKGLGASLPFDAVEKWERDR